MQRSQRGGRGQRWRWASVALALALAGCADSSAPASSVVPDLDAADGAEGPRADVAETDGEGADVSDVDGGGGEPFEDAPTPGGDAVDPPPRADVTAPDARPGPDAEPDAAGCTPLECDDGDPCTDDRCDRERGCWHEANTAPCDDGDACTTGDQCAEGVCVGGPPVGCDDGDVCTDDACDPERGCLHEPNVAPCDDGDVCTVGDQCAGGACVGGATLVCDDGDVCTDDGCDPESGCWHQANTAPCEDGDACTEGDQCAAGVCVAGAAVDCDDDNVCTAWECEPAAGCQYTPLSGPCEDGDACTVGTQCAGGICQAAAFVNCDDGNPCTLDTCAPKSGCQHAATPGAPCDDGDACTFGDYCVISQCQPGAPLDCEDGNPCTVTACDSASGCIAVARPDGAACEDGDGCTVGDECQGGECVGALTYCCAAPEPWPALCGSTRTVAMGAESGGSYSGACGPFEASGGVAIGCLPNVPASMEVCVDAPALASGHAMLFEDVAPALQPQSCAIALEHGACVPVASASATTLFWQAVFHASQGGAGAPVRYHARCPQANNNCATSGLKLACDAAVRCTAGGVSWSSAVSSYGACGASWPHPHRAFRFTAPQDGDYSVWLSSPAGVDNLRVLVAPAPDPDAPCSVAVAQLCTEHGPSPKTVSATAGQPLCIFVEQLEPLGNIELVVSVSCH